MTQTADSPSADPPRPELMTDPSLVLSAHEITSLRERHYNATLIERLDVHSDLARFRIRPDDPIPPFDAGQYVAMGLGNWEPRIAGTQPEPLPADKFRKLTRRAYSISCPLVRDLDAGIETTVGDVDYLEFYVILVRAAGDDQQKPPSLTPRLFGLRVGDRLTVEKKIVGHYRLGQIDPDQTVLMLGTGTGEAPHNAMAAELLRSGHRGTICVATSVRNKADLGYLREHQSLMRRHANYRYLPLTTREPENIDSGHRAYVGKQYLQRLFLDGSLATLAGAAIDPADTHVFLCGNPAMIGYTAPGAAPPAEPGLLPLLKSAGFREDEGDGGAGTIRFEKYW